jgi:hypothetical protein
MPKSSPWELYERLSEREIASLSPEQRPLVAVGSLRTEVNNGGFHQYFFNSAADLAADALAGAEAAGADGLADLIGRAMFVLSVADISDRGVRQDRLQPVDPDVFEDLDEAFYGLEASTDLDAVMRTLMP